MVTKTQTKKDKRKLKVEVTPLIKKIEALTKRLVRTRTMGEYISVFKGGGLEFDGYKQYDPSIDANAIDWKASVRAKEILVKKYREIRDLEVYFVVDVSESMIFGSTEKLKNEYAAEFILSLAYTVIGVGDAVGLITFSDKVISRIKAAKGTNQFYKIASSLVDPDLYGGSYDLPSIEEFLLNFVKRKGSVIILVSDFYGLKGGNLWRKRMKYLAAKFDVICIVVRDPRDKYLPDDVRNVMVEDPFTGSRLMIDSSLIKSRYEAYVKKQDRELLNQLKDANVDAVELPTDMPLLSALMDFFKTRRQGMIL